MRELTKVFVAAPRMIDLTAPEIMEITIRSDGKVVWINTEAGCVFRASKIGELIVLDNRPGDQEGQND